MDYNSNPQFLNDYIKDNIKVIKKIHVNIFKYIMCILLVVIINFILLYYRDYLSPYINIYMDNIFLLIIVFLSIINVYIIIFLLFRYCRFKQSVKLLNYKISDINNEFLNFMNIQDRIELLRRTIIIININKYGIKNNDLRELLVSNTDIDLNKKLSKDVLTKNYKEIIEYKNYSIGFLIYKFIYIIWSFISFICMGCFFYCNNFNTIVIVIILTSIIIAFILLIYIFRKAFKIHKNIFHKNIINSIVEGLNDVDNYSFKEKAVLYKKIENVKFNYLCNN